MNEQKNSEIPDGKLTKLLSSGNMVAMETIYHKLFTQVYNYAKSYVTDSDQAYEITQDTFVYLWEKRFSLRPDSNLKAYLLRIAKNKSLNYIESLKVRQKYFDHLKWRETSINYEALKNKSAELVLIQELEKIIAEVLDTMPEPCRIVFEMNRNEDLSYAEIAERLGVSVKTIEHRMMLALKIFRKKLHPYLSLIILFINRLQS